MDVLIELEINAPAEKVWEILAHRFADIATWSSTVTESRAIGKEEVPPEVTVATEAPIPGRETKTKAATLREILTEYSEQERTLTFYADGLPKMIPLATDRQVVTELGPDRCKVSFDVHMSTRFPLTAITPLMKKRIAKTFGIVQDDLRTLAETGHVSWTP